MDESARPFLFEPAACRAALPACRAALPALEVTEDIDGTLDWLSQGKGATPFAIKASALVPFGGGYETDGSTDDSVAASESCPPVWPGESVVPVPAANVAASPCETLEAFCSFFEHGVPAVVTREAWELSVTASVDFVVVSVKVRLYASAGAADATVVLFQPCSQRDVVRFHQLWYSAVGHLAGQGLVVTPLSNRYSAVHVRSHGFEDSFTAEHDADWPLCAEATMEAACSPDRLLREEGLQMLASWASSRPDSRVAIAEALQARAGRVQALVMGYMPLAELYPLAVTLKFAAQQCGEVPDMRPILRIVGVLAQKSELPLIVSRELREALGSLALQMDNIGEDGTAAA